MFSVCKVFSSGILKPVAVGVALGPSSTISQMVNKFDLSVKFINHLTDSRGRALAVNRRQISNFEVNLSSEQNFKEN